MRSVVLAACEGERFIAEQLDSITAQLAPDDEIVVCDDASTDATVDIILRRRDPRIRIYANKVRLGYIRNFELAVGFASGDIIFFSDQDDVWLPNKVVAMELALRQKACAASDAIVVNERLSVMYESYFAWRGTREFSAFEMFRRPAIIGATLACKRYYLKALLPFPRGVPHDFWVTLNAAWDDSLAIVTEPLILYRRHDAAASPSGTGRRRPWKAIMTERALLAAALILRRALRIRPRLKAKISS
jgi:glycosyltransferase involved in cell wall biosynthesis